VSSVREFYFETPLYAPIRVDEIEGDVFYGDVDAYSNFLESDTTYGIRAKDMDSSFYAGFKTVRLVNRRDSRDVLYFFLFADENLITKVGQAPSLADMQMAEVDKKYRNHLDKNELKELKKAIGLAAHGEGAGSFVHLRRIFESLIKDAYSSHSKDFNLSDADFKALRMVDKVKALKTYLPSELVEMKDVYSILSKGVHELSEQECKTYFPIMKLSIELILDQKIEEDAKAERARAVKAQLASIKAELSK
jgi:hypothetical protein